MATMKLTEITQGSRVIVLDEGKRQEAIVNGDPFVVAVLGVEPTDVEARIPCYVHATDRCIIAHPSNIYAVLS
jgi:hypothetical protein